MVSRLSNIRARVTLAAAAAALALSFAGPAQAIPLSIGNAVSDGVVTYTLNDCGFNTVTCASTSFSGDFHLDGTHGIRITGPDPSFGPLLTALAGESMDLSLEFIVTGSNLREVTLGMGGKVDTGGAITITEHVYDLNNDVTFQLALSTPSTSITDLSDSTGTLTTSTSLILDKDIFLNGPGQITYVTQRTRVPEPSGLSLLLVAGGIVLALRRREAVIRLLRRSIA